MISLIAIPGRGYYTILVDAEGQHPPALQLVTDRHLISEAKDLYMVAPFEPIVASAVRMEEVKRPCPVELRAEGQPALVLGEEVPTIKGAAFRAIAHLVRVYPRGAGREELDRVGDTTNITAALKSLVRRDGRWLNVLRFPRGVGHTRGTAGMYSLCNPGASGEAGRQGGAGEEASAA